MQRDLVELVGEAPLGSLAAQAGQAVPKSLRDRLRLGLSRELGKRFGEFLCLGVPDVQSHGAIPCRRVVKHLHGNSRRCQRQEPRLYAALTSVPDWRSMGVANSGFIEYVSRVSMDKGSLEE